MKAYLYDETDESDYMHDHDSGHAVSVEELNKIGVLYYHLETMDEVNKLAKEREYKNRDTVRLNPATYTGDKKEFTAKLDGFFKEHLHEDEEIRYIIKGSGFFDVRDAQDRWVRCKLFKYDLLILPAGIYHRFALDTNMDVETLRLFKDEPKWQALPRPVANNECREQYLKTISV